MSSIPSAASAPRAPYALEPIEFPFPGLAALAGRSALGGPREIALACFLVARIVVETVATAPAMSVEQRKARAHGARTWLSAAAIPTQLRSGLTRLLESTFEEDRSAIKAALDSVMTVTANQLDSAARLELGGLAQAVVK